SPAACRARPRSPKRMAETSAKPSEPSALDPAAAAAVPPRVRQKPAPKTSGHRVCWAWTEVQPVYSLNPCAGLQQGNKRGNLESGRRWSSPKPPAKADDSYHPIVGGV